MTDPLSTARALFRRNATLNMSPDERVELAHTCARVALEYGGPDTREADEGFRALLDDTAGITCSDRCWPVDFPDDEAPTQPHATCDTEPPEAP